MQLVVLNEVERQNLIANETRTACEHKLTKLQTALEQVRFGYAFIFQKDLKHVTSRYLIEEYLLCIGTRLRHPMNPVGGGSHCLRTL
jgi:hypothetical protein